MTDALKAIVFDAAHPASLARFWADTLRYAVRPYDDREIERLRSIGIDDVEDDPSVVIDAPDARLEVWFQKVPEAKSGKNRLHLDVRVDGDDGVAALERRGAKTLRRFDEPHGRWVVMADPEGNEFCALLP